MRRACFAVVLAAMACGHEREQVRASPTSSTTSTAPSPSTTASSATPAAETKREPPGTLSPSASNPRSRMEEPQKSTSRGVQLLTLPASGKPMVTIALRFHGGAADDPPGKAGITALAARVMSEGGTQALDSKALLLALFPLAASVDARVDKELTTFWSTVHKDNLDKLLPILIDVVAHPRWDPREFTRLRDAAVNDVDKRLRQGDDENLGKESLGESIYRAHPYGHLTQGHVSDLRGLTLEEVKAHSAKVFSIDRLTVGVSGGYPADLPDRVASALGDLAKSAAEPAAIPQQKPQKPRYLLVEKQADSTAISCGFPWSLSHGDPDWPAMSVARSAFGEHRQFNGRLMQRLRELRGLNYGDYAYIEHFQQAGGNAATAQLGRARHQQDFSIWLRPVQNENRLFALRAALYEVQRSLGDEPFAAEEVEQTKGFLDGYLLLFDQTDERKLLYALDDDFLGIPGFLQKWRAALREITADQVNAAWRKWMKPEALQCALAGPGMGEVKRVLLSNAETPMHYQKDAQGNVPEKPPALLESDRAVNRTPFAAQGDQDVQIVPVERMFE